MALQRTTYEHIALQENGVPVIAGTNTKVIELVQEVYAWGWSPEEICYQHPYLTLGQVHSALAYYWDHKDELDADILRRNERLEQLKHEIGPSQIAARLKNTQ